MGEVCSKRRSDSSSKTSHQVVILPLESEKIWEQLREVYSTSDAITLVKAWRDESEELMDLDSGPGLRGVALYSVKIPSGQKHPQSFCIVHVIYEELSALKRTLGGFANFLEPMVPFLCRNSVQDGSELNHKWAKQWAEEARFGETLFHYVGAEGPSSHPGLRLTPIKMNEGFEAIVKARFCVADAEKGPFKVLQNPEYSELTSFVCIRADPTCMIMISQWETFDAMVNRVPIFIELITQVLEGLVEVPPAYGEPMKPLWDIDDCNEQYGMVWNASFEWSWPKIEDLTKYRKSEFQQKFELSEDSIHNLYG